MSKWASLNSSASHFPQTPPPFCDWLYSDRLHTIDRKPQILSPGRKSWVSLRTAVVHCVPGLLPRRKMSGSFKALLASSS
ncbi:hypothetical protein T08_11827 [Trichinella sp. T8]|nr:hypothetical protein T08_11827 [Trichinella sp. T8]